MKKEMFALMILVVSCLALVSINAQNASAALGVPSVYINEFEADPLGTDPEKEWVELYNAENETVNLSGWTISDGLGATAPGVIFTFPNETTLSAGEFYVVDLSGSRLNNNGEFVTLKNELNETVDETPEQVDNENDHQTWQRITEGADTWVMKEETEGTTNYIPAEISNEEVAPFCAFENDNITLSAEVRDWCGGEVIFAVENDGEWLNFTAQADGNEYSAVVPAGTLSAPQNVNWKVLAEDCAAIVTEGGLQNFTLHSFSSLTTLPGSPDGLNGWFVTEPSFTIENLNAENITYRWNGNYHTEIGNSVTFGLENAPNNGEVNGGVLTLRYQSSVGCGVEEEQEFVGKFDFTSPVIMDVLPGDNSTIQETEVVISALIDELYAQNSGVDEDSIELRVDGNLTTPEIENSGTLDKKIELELELAEGAHEVELTVSDNAGRTSVKTWIFNINTSEGLLALTVNSPQNEIYDDRKVQFNLTTLDDVDEITYINHNENKPRERILCRNCDSYGLDRARHKNFLEGENNVTFIARDGDLESSVEVTFIVDSKEPSIGRVSPARGFTNGEFEVEFREANPTGMRIVFGNDLNGFTQEELNVTEVCEKDGESHECVFDVNLSDYEGQEITYFLELTDITNKTDESRDTRVEVDMVEPVFDLVNFTVEGRRVEFTIGVNETNFDRLTYVDLAEGREKRLCSRLSDGVCEVTKNFRLGEHNLTLTAYDDAGNFDEEEIYFVVLG